MQRLFSMFPTGAAGIALLILRLSAAAALLSYGSSRPLSFWSLCLPASSAAALCLGLLTPYASVIGCLIELAAVIPLENQRALPIIFSIVNTASLALLGPGAYSLDARFFGRRIINFAARHKSDPS